MMTHPLFLSGQRYRASGLDQRVIYLAAWVVESPAAFETPQYRASWGFADWAPHITDWSRNLFRGISFTMNGENLLNRQHGEPDNITVVPGRTLSFGLRAIM